MKINTYRYGFVLAVLFAITNYSFSQTDVSLEPECGARVAVAIYKKISKGFHISLEEEARFDKNFTGFDCFHTTLGLSYKVNPYLKFGLGYTFITPYSSSAGTFKSFRHRVYADATGSVKFGNFTIALKERFQWTYRMGDMNLYQNPRNALTLKSRLTFKYRINKVTPYLFFEIRNTFNSPVIYANYDEATDTYVTDSGSETGNPGWFLHSYKGAYINRLRGAVGIDLKINKKNELGFYFLGDYNRDRVVDANSSGTKLKSYTFEKGFFGTIGAEYVFSF